LLSLPASDFRTNQNNASSHSLYQKGRAFTKAYKPLGPKQDIVFIYFYIQLCYFSVDKATMVHLRKSTSLQKSPPWYSWWV